jgi:hypothetical protein
MSYRIEWIGGLGFYGTLVLLLIVPEFAMIAVLVVALAALVAVVALAAAAIASPYLLMRSLRRRLAQRTPRRRTRWIRSPGAIPMTRSLRRRTGPGQPVLRSAAVRRGAAEDAHTSGT